MVKRGHVHIGKPAQAPGLSLSAPRKKSADASHKASHAHAKESADHEELTEFPWPTVGPRLFVQPKGDTRSSTPWRQRDERWRGAHIRPMRILIKALGRAANTSRQARKNGTMRPPRAAAWIPLPYGDVTLTKHR